MQYADIKARTPNYTSPLTDLHSSLSRTIGSHTTQKLSIESERRPMMILYPFQPLHLTLIMLYSTLNHRVPAYYFHFFQLGGSTLYDLQAEIPAFIVLGDVLCLRCLFRGSNSAYYIYFLKHFTTWWNGQKWVLPWGISSVSTDASEVSRRFPHWRNSPYPSSLQPTRVPSFFPVSTWVHSSHVIREDHSVAE